MAGAFFVNCRPWGPLRWVAALTLVGCAVDESSGTESPDALEVEEASRGNVPEGSVSAAGCRALTTSGLRIPGVKITKTQVVAARASSSSGSDPAHCWVTGALNERTGSDGQPYAIGFELRMPARWNRGFFFQGGAGMDGFILPAGGVTFNGTGALNLGYAVTSMDGGHRGGAVFGFDPQARIDYGYNAIGMLTPVVKQIIAKFYGTMPERSYFVGCSNGGRQALVSAARFADQFDGILAGDPGFNLPKAAVQSAWNTQQFLSVSPNKIKNAFRIDEMKTVGQQVLAKCDGLDGAQDGMVFDTAGCQAAFDLQRDVPTCSGARTGSCLTVQQKKALQNVMSGARNSRGEPLYADFPWDPGIAAAASGGESWRAWNLENAMLGGPSFIATATISLPYVFVTPPVDLRKTPPVNKAVADYLANFDFDVDAPKIEQTSGPFTESAMSFMTPPNPTHLNALRSRGKLIVFHGLADPIFSSSDTVRWYEGLRRDMPGAEDFARLFLVPGMGHCGGGMALGSFDLFGALVEWVERGNAPESVVARRAAAKNPDFPQSWSPERTRPLCAYPKHAVWTPGASDLESASSFHCE